MTCKVPSDFYLACTNQNRVRFGHHLFSEHNTSVEGYEWVESSQQPEEPHIHTPPQGKPNNPGLFKISFGPARDVLLST